MRMSISCTVCSSGDMEGDLVRRPRLDFCVLAPRGEVGNLGDCFFFLVLEVLALDEGLETDLEMSPSSPVRLFFLCFLPE